MSRIPLSRQFRIAIFCAVAWLSACSLDPCLLGQGLDQDERQTKTEKMSEALSYSTMGNHAKAMELLQELRLAYPNDLEVKLLYFRRVKSRSGQLVTSGQKAEGYEMYKLAAELVREIVTAYAEKANMSADVLAEFKKENSYLLYNEACSFALAGEKEKCISSLREAIQWGFNNLNHMLNDLDLAEIADSEEFETLLGEDLVTYKTKLRETAIERLKRFNPIAFDIELPDLQGNAVKIADYRGKVVLLTFWASGNIASRNNLEMLKRLQRNFADKDIVILTVGCERTKEVADAVQQLNEYVVDNNIPFPVLVGNTRLRVRMKQTQGFPATMLLDKNGQMRAGFPNVVPYHVAATFADIMTEGDLDKFLEETESSEGKKPEDEGNTTTENDGQ